MRKNERKHAVGKMYADYLTDYAKRIAPLRSKRLREARKRIKTLKARKGYTKHVRNNINPWINEVVGFRAATKSTTNQK